jgi:hypothetical protein
MRLEQGMDTGADHLLQNEQSESGEALKTPLVNSDYLPTDRCCLPFPEMGMDIESVEAYLEQQVIEPV